MSGWHKYKNVRLWLTLLTCWFGADAMGQWSYTDLSAFRYYMNATRHGDSLFFVGGGSKGKTAQKTIFVYNTRSQKWEDTMTMKHARYFPFLVSGDSALYIAGGLTIDYHPVHGFRDVEMYNYHSKTWSVHTVKDSMLWVAATKAGSKVMFGAPTLAFSTNSISTCSDVVYMYDEREKTWTTEHLSEVRCAESAVSNDTIALIIGGIRDSLGANHSNRIDIYNSLTDEWTVDSLSAPRITVGGVYVNGKFYLAGGWGNDNSTTDVIDVYDGKSWSVMHLPKPMRLYYPQVIGDEIYFAAYVDANGKPGSSIPVYNTRTGSWSEIHSMYARSECASITDGKRLYLAGGAYAKRSTSLVEIYEPEKSSVFELGHNAVGRVYPNPTNGTFRVSFTQAMNVDIIIHDPLGRATQSMEVVDSRYVDLDLTGPVGVYLVEFRTDDAVEWVKVVKN